MRPEINKPLYTQHHEFQATDTLHQVIIKISKPDHSSASRMEAGAAHDNHDNTRQISSIKVAIWAVAPLLRVRINALQQTEINYLSKVAAAFPILEDSVETVKEIHANHRALTSAHHNSSCTSTDCSSVGRVCFPQPEHSDLFSFYIYNQGYSDHNDPNLLLTLFSSDYRNGVIAADNMQCLCQCCELCVRSLASINCDSCKETGEDCLKLIAGAISGCALLTIKLTSMLLSATHTSPETQKNLMKAFHATYPVALTLSVLSLSDELLYSLQKIATHSYDTKYHTWQVGRIITPILCGIGASQLVPQVGPYTIAHSEIMIGAILSLIAAKYTFCSSAHLDPQTTWKCIQSREMRLKRVNFFNIGMREPDELILPISVINKLIESDQTHANVEEKMTAVHGKIEQLAQEKNKHYNAITPGMSWCKFFKQPLACVFKYCTENGRAYRDESSLMSDIRSGDTYKIQLFMQNNKNTNPEKSMKS